MLILQQTMIYDAEITLSKGKVSETVNRTLAVAAPVAVATVWTIVLSALWSGRHLGWQQVAWVVSHTGSRPTSTKLAAATHPFSRLAD